MYGMKQDRMHYPSYTIILTLIGKYIRNEKRQNGLHQLLYYPPTPGQIYNESNKTECINLIIILSSHS
jgi:hypothetical protein